MLLKMNQDAWKVIQGTRQTFWTSFLQVYAVEDLATLQVPEQLGKLQGGDKKIEQSGRSNALIWSCLQSLNKAHFLDDSIDKASPYNTGWKEKIWNYTWDATDTGISQVFSHHPPNTQMNSIFQLFMIYEFKNLSSISTGNLPFWYLFLWSLTWLKVRSD